MQTLQVIEIIYLIFSNIQKDKYTFAAKCRKGTLTLWPDFVANEYIS